MTSIKRGSVFVVSAPSGAGKTTMIHKLINSQPNYELTISYTTRQPRKEAPDSNYVFVKEDKFRKMISDGELLEYTENYGNLYGTPELDYEKKVKEGNIIFFEVEWRGAIQIKKRFKELVHIYILPMSSDILRERIISRGCNDDQKIERRMSNAMQEMSHYVEADYVIFNDNLEQAYKELESIVLAEQLRIENVIVRKQKKLENLLN